MPGIRDVRHRRNGIRAGKNPQRSGICRRPMSWTKRLLTRPLNPLQGCWRTSDTVSQQRCGGGGRARKGHARNTVRRHGEKRQGGDPRICRARNHGLPFFPPSTRTSAIQLLGYRTFGARP
jgi:hypothetical protein